MRERTNIRDGRSRIIISGLQAKSVIDQVTVYIQRSGQRSGCTNLAMAACNDLIEKGLLRILIPEQGR